MIGRLVSWSIRRRLVVVGLTLTMAAVALFVAQYLEFDALPDITGNQVVVLTGAPGHTPEEVELLVTRPIEAALGGLPGARTQRSVSRFGISSVTVIFEDDVDLYHARQLVQERLNTLAGALPEGVETPELGPITGGLGEIFHFTLSSRERTPAELYEIATLTVAPMLRSAPGVVEVNTWGGRRRTLDLVADPVKMAALRVTLPTLVESLEDAIGSAPGASVRAPAGQVLLRGIFRPDSYEDLGGIVVKDDERPIRAAELGTVTEGAAFRLGTATANGRGETVYVMVQMLRDANALEVMDAIHERMPQVREVLPDDVRVSVVYDRSKLVEATLHTVFMNLLEGGLLVVAVLFLMLGSFRAGFLTALVIPLSMLGAVVGMTVLDIPGNLMSLGAIDFGLLVDGAVVMVEGFFHDMRQREYPSGDQQERMRRFSEVAAAVARPVFFSILIILLVYVPILSLTGVDGKMFRPMAITVIIAIATSLILALTFIPAASTLLLRPKDLPKRPPILLRVAQRLHRPQLRFAMRRPLLVFSFAVLMVAFGAFLFTRAGTSFIPQLDEGDLVVQTTRAPDVSIEQATEAATRMERILLERVPEVTQVVSRIGSPAVATDIMGLEQADVFIALEPKDAWREGLSREELVAEIERLLRREQPGSNPSFTQPIQMRFNELVGGETTDVAVSIYGPDLDVLRRTADRVAAAIEGLEGAADVRITAPPSVSLIEVRPEPLAGSQLGVGPNEVLDAVAAIRSGVEVGYTYEGMVQVPVRIRIGDEPTVQDVTTLPIPTERGDVVPMSRVAQVTKRETPSLISHEDGLRRIVVGFNVRGRDLGGVVKDAMARVDAQVVLPAGYRIDWGGQYETLAAAKDRMLVVVPAVLVMIFVILLIAFRRFLPAVLIFANVPFAGVGGIIALTLRDMPVSISAAVGFIALSGIAVLNGVVLMNRILAFEEQGGTRTEAARQAAEQRLRPVLMTALVAALGFVPMMLATGVGAEVQRPLATVVVGGLIGSTFLTLVILPSVYSWVGRSVDRAQHG